MCMWMRNSSTSSTPWAEEEDDFPPPRRAKPGKRPYDRLKLPSTATNSRIITRVVCSRVAHRVLVAPKREEVVIVIHILCNSSVHHKEDTVSHNRLALLDTRMIPMVAGAGGPPPITMGRRLPVADLDLLITEVEVKVVVIDILLLDRIADPAAKVKADIKITKVKVHHANAMHEVRLHEVCLRIRHTNPR
jgi:hypothetical protein